MSARAALWLLLLFAVSVAVDDATALGPPQSAGQASSADADDYYPIALQYRKRLVEQIELTVPAPVAAALIAVLPAALPRLAVPEGPAAVGGTETVYTFMTLLC